MNLEIKGKAKNVKSRTICDAVEFYAGHLLTKRLKNKISLKINISKSNLPDNIDGFCDWMDDNKSPRDFEITVRPNLSKEETLTLIAHEMVHLKQHATNQLFDYARGTTCRYNGKVYDRDKIDYWELPWEIEAYGRERGLYVRYLHSKRDK